MQKFFGYLNSALYTDVCSFRDGKTKRYIRSLTELCNFEVEQLTESLSNFNVTKETIYKNFEQVILRDSVKATNEIQLDNEEKPADEED